MFHGKGEEEQFLVHSKGLMFFEHLPFSSIQTGIRKPSITPGLEAGGGAVVPLDPGDSGTIQEQVWEVGGEWFLT